MSLVERIGAPEGLPLLDLDYSTTSHTDPDTLQPIDLDFAFSLADLAGIRWRQSDFLDRVFRRSFAGRAVADAFRAFRGIQVTPVGDRPDLPRAWITGTFLLDPQIAFGLPFGVANLTMFSVAASRQGVATPSAPEAWNNLCRDDRRWADREDTARDRRLVSIALLDGTDDRRRSGLGRLSGLPALT